jgi:hypothetical protein
MKAVLARKPDVGRSMMAALLSLLLFPGALFAGVEAVPKPARGQTDYKTTAAVVEPATFVAITYYGGAIAIVADEKVVAEFKRLIATAGGRPASYCFCINYPQVTFLTKEGPLFTVEAPHGKKLRFYGKGYFGDFEVDPSLAQAFDKLAMAQQADAIKGLKGLSQLDLPKPSPPDMGR